MLPLTSNGRILSVEETLAYFKSRGITRYSADMIEQQAKAYAQHKTLASYLANCGDM